MKHTFLVLFTTAALALVTSGCATKQTASTTTPTAKTKSDKKFLASQSTTKPGLAPVAAGPSTPWGSSISPY